MQIDLDALVKGIESDFKPSTIFEQGDLVKTDYEIWNRTVLPAQQEDWKKIKRKLRGTWGKLKWYEKGWVFNHFRGKYNWMAWSTEEGVALQLTLYEKRKKV
jgi:hypothetical protein